MLPTLFRFISESRFSRPPVVIEPQGLRGVPEREGGPSEIEERTAQHVVSGCTLCEKFSSADPANPRAHAWMGAAGSAD